MAVNERAEEIGHWKKEKVLGSGGFGYVILWRNKETNETIALKECRWGHDPMMTPKHRSRWKLEVDMMFRLNHPNVVKAIAVPPELDVPVTEMPVLAMEYCSSGDLRKCLNKPENCCGLNEKHVRLLLRHVSSAVNYLHSMRIIHRDLKPENIVIQDVNGTVIYKLIDLGYAKELDQGSLCTSFVGTLQYLAPELFMSQKYSCTVDYWSLGLLTHEVITGFRPFLPDKSPAEWIPIIKQKTSSQIRAFLDDDKNIVFSSEISPFHHICSIFEKDIAKWLQIMLEWDPKKRGRCENTSAFSLLEKVLDKKVALVFCVPSFKLLSFSVDESLSLEDFEKQIEVESGIPINQQEIIFPKGHVPNPDKSSIQFLSNVQEDEMIVFLFDKRELPVSSTSPSPSIPLLVENMMRNPRAEVEYQAQRFVWAQAVYLSQQECLLFSRLIRAFKANLMHLLTKTSFTHKNASRMTAEMNKILSKCVFFKNSLELDINSYEKQAQSGGFTSQLMIDGWKSNLENLKKIDLLRQKIIALEEASASISTRTVELQRSSYARSKQSSPMEDTHQKVLDAFAELRRRPKEQRRIPHDNTDIVRLLCLCLQQRQIQIQDIMLHFRKINQIKREIDDVFPQIINLQKEISEWDSQVELWQSKRQRELWKVFDALNNRLHQVERSSSPLLLSNSHSPLPSRQAVNFRRPERSSSPSFLSSSPQSTIPSRRSGSLTRPIYSHLNPELAISCNQDMISLQSTLLKLDPPVIPPPAWQSKLEPLALNSTFRIENNSNQMESSSSNPSLGVMSLSSLLDQKSEESRQIIKENDDLVENFQRMIESLKDCQKKHTNSDVRTNELFDSSAKRKS